MKLDFGLSDKIISDDTRSDWSHQFGLTYSITLSTDELETSLQVRNTSQEAWEFQLLFHTYLKIDVSSSMAEYRLLEESDIGRVLIVARPAGHLQGHPSWLRANTVR